MPVSRHFHSQPYRGPEFRYFEEPAVIRHGNGSGLCRTRLLVLAPPHASVPPVFRNRQYDALRHEELLAEMQRLRGNVYVEDGAIGPHELSAGGRHRLETDEDSWHLLALDQTGAVTGCARYRAHRNSAGFRDLWVRNSALAQSPIWGRQFLSAVESQIHQARRRNISYAEVGGWATAPERRYTTDALRVALATYSLAQLLGGCIGITTATVKHCSSAILRRIGGRSLESPAGTLPSYYDPAYKCEMEVLGFDSASPTPKYLPIIGELRSGLRTVPVVAPRSPRRMWSVLPLQHEGIRHTPAVRDWKAIQPA